MSLKARWRAQFVCWKWYVSANCYQQQLCFWHWIFSLLQSNTHIPSEITESQSGWGWKGPLKIIWSSPPVQAGPPRASCPGPHPDGFWLSPIYSHLSGQPVPVLSHPHSKKVVSWCSEGTCCVSVCAHCLWSCHWAPWKRAWLPLLCTLPSGSYIHWWDPQHTLI